MTAPLGQASCGSKQPSATSSDKLVIKRVFIMNEFSLDHFQSLLCSVTDAIGEAPLNQQLEDLLNERFPSGGDTFLAIESSCHAGIEAGVLCQREAAGIKFGRVVEACPEIGNFSVDVVQMKDVKGPHHRHPQGEIDLIIPISDGAKFDGRGAGWLVYGADSAHFPTVSDGEALVLYLLPNGEIEFTRTR